MTELHGVWGAIGSTPLVLLDRLFPTFKGTLYAKLEFLNPGGSQKDRSAFGIVSAAVRTGRIAKGGMVIESTTGNMGIGLAQACKYFGLRLVCVVDYRTTQANRRILEAYGAEVDVVTDTSQPLRARLERVRDLLAATPGAFWPDQHVNDDNPAAHRETTALEIINALGRAPDVVICAVGTCGTISGIDSGIRERGGATALYAVDLIGSALFGAAPGVRLVPGIGSSRAKHFPVSDRVKPIYVTDRDCVAGCRLLLDREAIFAGGSAGAVVTAASRLCMDLEPGLSVVLILPDRGERYLDTIYCEEWVNSLPRNSAQEN